MEYKQIKYNDIINDNFVIEDSQDYINISCNEDETFKIDFIGIKRLDKQGEIKRGCMTIFRTKLNANAYYSFKTDKKYFICDLIELIYPSEDNIFAVFKEDLTFDNLIEQKKEQNHIDLSKCKWGGWYKVTVKEGTTKYLFLENFTPVSCVFTDKDRKSVV